ncbi:type VII secretion integral membrane protein EccD [Tessaracoccus oleiagri]|uniref:Type VII secretion integral membrane protein EccD n=1 Tax=Tessaracoccus oleiagri TaxID=686624 RepID=A0A1G9HG96_9ACTN|nr:type VII secretion integral membrane protein EccD [Tessaracoccus oleiagri]SDL12061.1 type VII secretion integral membrane protein EccD [Tessaracoccus oleiagri]
MSTPVQEEDLARVTIISSHRRVDLALPGSVSLSELLPSILRFAGLEANSPTDAVHAWVLQRFGSDPFDLYAPISKLGIRDGETLHLRQRENAIPDAAFDDVVDAVASATNARPSWAARHSRTISLVLLGVLLVFMPFLIILGTSDEGRLARGIVLAATGFLSFAAFIAAIALARAARERPTSTVLAWCSVVLAGVVGWYLPYVIATNAALHIHILMASSLVLASAAANALAARVHTMPLFAAALFGGIMLASSSVMALNFGHDAEVAAGTMAVLVFVTAFFPTLSFQIAGIALPNLPVTTEAMLADDTPVQSDIVERAVFADRLLAGMLTGTVAAATASAFIAMQQGSVWAVALVLSVGLAFLMRARAFVGLAQRLALLLGGAVITGVGVLAIAMAATSSLIGLLVLFGVTLLGAYLLAHYSASWHAKILSPTWGRWGDIFEWLAIIGIVPFMLGVLDFYVWFRSLFNI